ncbi:MAG: hypothetical protein KF886_24720 [Candidatus Hydrogenedentes bacterium]|nr:hypothetical protein [Candidatus Hydrogenedentota bacterium]
MCYEEWTGAASGASASVNVTMDEDKSVNAVFYQTTLTVTKTGEGQVTADPYGATQTPTFSEDYEPGETVTLTAVPAAGWGFKEWTGAASGASASVNVTMDEDKSVNAVFYQTTLTVTKSGEGQVTADPYGATQTPTFSEDYEPGETVTLTAVPAAGWAFREWSGAAIGGALSANVTMTADKSVNAIFEQLQLTVSKVGEGTVTPPGGGETLPHTITYGSPQTVGLTASPAAGWGFKEWTGDASGENPSTSVVVDGSRAVTAVFAQVELTVDKEGEGTVSVSPPGGAQTLPFTGTYPYGEGTVSLTASPSTNWFFDRWDGDVPEAINGDENIDVNCKQDRNVSAVFTECEVDIALMAIRFTDTAAVRAYPSEELLNNGLHYDMFGTNNGPIAPVRYGFGAKPTLYAEFWIESTDCTELLIRAKAGATVLGQTVKSVGAPPNLISVDNLGGTIEIPGHDKVGGHDTTVTFQYSTDNGSTWRGIGSGGPTEWYVMPDEDSHGEIPFDLTLDKNVQWADGLEDIDDVAEAICNGIAAEVNYDPTELTPTGHILTVYSIGKAQCEANAMLMEHHCKVAGISASLAYLWGGSSPSLMEQYVYKGWLGPTFRTTAAANGSAQANPHFLFHVLTTVGGIYYDPSYGTTGLTSFDEIMPPYSIGAGGSVSIPPAAGETAYSPSQQLGSGFPASSREITWVCPH